MEPQSDWPNSLDPFADDRPRERIGLGGLILVALGSLLAVPGVFFGTLSGGENFLGPIVIGPLIEETLKPTGLVILLTIHPGLRLGAAAGVAVGAFSGLTFATIENAIYLLIYVPDHEPWLVVWRWTVCVCLHVGCSALVGYGLARATQKIVAADSEQFSLLGAAAGHLLEEPRERSGVFQGASLVCLTIAVILHGVYNLAAIVLL